MCVSYWCMLRLTFTTNKSVQEKEKVNMLHKAENLYFNVTFKKRPKRIGQKNVISYGFEAMQSKVAPEAVQKTSTVATI